MLLNPVPWPGEQLPTEAALRHILHSEGLAAQHWAAAPGVEYAAHAHHATKVLYVVTGSITFALPEDGQSLTLSAGDRIELPAGVRHTAAAGDEGVTCLEAYRTGAEPPLAS